MLVPSPYSRQLNPVVDRYSDFKKGTSRTELEAQLGKPSREEKDGAAVWETRFDQINYATLQVWFDGEAKANKVEVTRAHGKSTLGYRSTAVVTWSK